MQPTSCSPHPLRDFIEQENYFRRLRKQAEASMLPSRVAEVCWTRELPFLKEQDDEVARDSLHLLQK